MESQNQKSTSHTSLDLVWYIKTHKDTLTIWVNKSCSWASKYYWLFSVSQYNASPNIHSIVNIKALQNYYWCTEHLSDEPGTLPYVLVHNSTGHHFEKVSIQLFWDCPSQESFPSPRSPIQETALRGSDPHTSKQLRVEQRELDNLSNMYSWYIFLTSCIHKKCPYWA